MEVDHQASGEDWTGVSDYVGSSTSRFQERGALDQKTAGRTGALNKGLTSALVDAGPGTSDSLRTYNREAFGEVRELWVPSGSIRAGL